MQLFEGLLGRRVAIVSGSICPTGSRIDPTTYCPMRMHTPHVFADVLHGMGLRVGHKVHPGEGCGAIHQRQPCVCQDWCKRTGGHLPGESCVWSDRAR